MIIYKITNKINGKVYIGQTIRPLQYRWKQHCNNKSNCYALHNAIVKYGKENFTIEQIDIAIDRNELDLKEIFWIKFYDSMNPNKGYNLTSGGGHCEFSEESRNKMSDARKGHWSGENNPNYGKPLSEEHRRKISEAKKGKHHSEESRNKISEACKGRIVSEETKRKLSELNKGKTLSEETKRKLSEAHKGGKYPQARKVMCIETGEIFDYIKLTTRKYKISDSSISSCCKGKRKTAGGYHWEYVK